ncbi:MAG: ferritin-like domain-containing protein [Thermovirgaceae bacterium]|nr:ferritin-like domain-containing protein [Thermovirgaceae bacterium]
MSDYHEPVEELAEEDRDRDRDIGIGRALLSLKEEIEAVDWYHQRAAATKDDPIRHMIIHNRNEEIEHASMMLEWLRRKMPAFDEALRTCLFIEAPITQVEAGAAGGVQPGEKSPPSGLGIGSLKGQR